MKKILVTGTFSTGKTTLCKRLDNHLRSKGIKSIVIPEASPRSCPLPINDKQTILGSLWLALKQIENEMSSPKSKEVVIFDKGLPDIVSHTYDIKMTTSDDKQLFSQLIKVAIENIKSYDAIYMTHCSESKEIAIDGVRLNDKAYQKRIQKNLHKFMEGAGVRYTILPFDLHSQIDLIVESICRY